VRHHEEGGGGWQYSAGSEEWLPFTPQQDDVLVAAVNLASGAATLLNGMSRTHRTMAVGYTSGDLHVRRCAWLEHGPVISFCVSGIFFLQNLRAGQTFLHF